MADESISKPLAQYAAFIEAKRHSIGNQGFDPVWMPDCAFDFQKHIIAKAIRKGRITAD